MEEGDEKRENDEKWIKIVKWRSKARWMKKKERSVRNAKTKYSWGIKQKKTKKNKKGRTINKLKEVE